LFSFTRKADKLTHVLGEYIPYVPGDRDVDSLFRYFSMNRNFIADSVTAIYVKGDFKNFVPPGLRPSKFVIEAEKYGPNSFYYASRACLDTSAVSKKILERTVDKLHQRLNGFFSKSISSEADEHERFPYKTYNYFTAGNNSPALLIGWGYNESKKFTGYYFEITLYTTVHD
jgi:hypothetical protein